MDKRTENDSSIIREELEAPAHNSEGSNRSDSVAGTNVPLSREGAKSTETSFDLTEVYQLWDNILDILFEKVNSRYVPISQVKHLVPEIRRLLSSAKGGRFLSNSVINLMIVMLEGDATMHELRLGMRCNDSTIYRALAKLQRIGFVEPAVGRQDARSWTIGRRNFPLLHLASRS